MTKQGTFARTGALGCQSTDQSVTARKAKLYSSSRIERTPNAGTARLLSRPREGSCAVAQLQVLANILLHHSVGKPRCCRAMIPQLPFACSTRYAPSRSCPCSWERQLHMLCPSQALRKPAAKAPPQGLVTIFSDHMSTSLPAQNDCVT